MASALLEIVEIGGQLWRVSAQRRRNLLGPRLTPSDEQRRAMLWLPAECTLAQAHELYAPRRNWLHRYIERRENKALRRRINVAPGQKIMWRGRELIVTHDPYIGRRVEIAEGQMLVGGPVELVSQRLKRWLRHEAERRYRESVSRYAQRLAVGISRISIRDTSSRWGSCSDENNLSFSWRPIMAPDIAVNYLAAHEVAHLKYLDHSLRFWLTVADLCADWTLGHDYLALMGDELMRYQFPK